MPADHLPLPPLPPPPLLWPMTRIHCALQPVVSLGPLPQGERRYVPLSGGHAQGPELNGTVLDGGVDWQLNRTDGVLEISAHYVIRTEDGALVEVQSHGLRHGEAAVMAALARGEAVPREAYFFRTQMRFATGASAWQHLNKVMAIASGERQTAQVVMDVYRLG